MIVKLKARKSYKMSVISSSRVDFSYRDRVQSLPPPSHKTNPPFAPGMYRRTRGVLPFTGDVCRIYKRYWFIHKKCRSSFALFIVRFRAKRSWSRSTVLAAFANPSVFCVMKPHLAAFGPGGSLPCSDDCAMCICCWLTVLCARKFRDWYKRTFRSTSQQSLAAFASSLSNNNW